MPETLTRRRLTLFAGATAIAAALPLSESFATEPRVYAIRVSRDASCGCCLAWVAHLSRSARFQPTVVEEADMMAVKQALGVPLDLASCHTAVVEGLVVEGHVPAADILRALEQPGPRRFLGLATPGMPRGSPGMENSRGVRDAFDVISFSADGARTVFAHYDRS